MDSCKKEICQHQCDLAIEEKKIENLDNVLNLMMSSETHTLINPQTGNHAFKVFV